MTTFSYTLPTVNGSQDTWGTTINANWTNIGSFLGSLDSAELAKLDGLTATTAELNVLSGVTASTAELNVLSGVTASTANINSTDGVTVNIQTQLDGKAALASPALTGNPTAPTAAVDSNETLLATTAYVVRAVANAARTTSATQDTTSGSSVDFSGIPSTATEIEIYFIGYTNTGTSRVQVFVGGSVVNTGYYSSSAYDGNSSNDTDGFTIYNNSSTNQHNGIMSLRKAASGTWVESHSLTLGTSVVSGGGSVTSLGAIDGIRVKANGAFSAGKIAISWR